MSLHSTTPRRRTALAMLALSLFLPPAVGCGADAADPATTAAVETTEPGVATEPADDAANEPPAADPAPALPPLPNELASDATQAALDESFGGFDMIEQEGAGETTIDLPEGVLAFAIEVSHADSDEVEVHAYAAKDAEEPYWKLMNSTEYSGTNVVKESSGELTTKLVVIADSWRLRVRPVSALRVLTLPADDAGLESVHSQDARVWEGPEINVSITGTENYPSVDGFTADESFYFTANSDDNVATDGTFQFDVVLPGDPAVVRMVRKGWAITKR